jgi:hypothetical protein
LLLGVAAAGAAALAWNAAAVEARAVEARLAAASAAPAAKKPQVAATPAEKVRGQSEAEARRALALPWERLLVALQDSRPDEVAFLALEAEGRQGSFQLTAVGRSHQAMLEYFRLLQTRPEFRAVSLTQHDTREIDGVSGVGFRLRGQWSAP